MKKIYNFFILGSYGQFNMGDDALLEVIRDELKGHKLIFSSDNPPLTRKRFNVEAIYTYPQKDFLAKIKTLLWCDAIIYGGGTIIIQKVKILLFMFFGNLVARILRKKVVYLGVGVGYIHASFLTKLLCKLIYLTANLITLRDEGCLEELERAGVTGDKIIVTADPVLLLKPVAKHRAWELLRKEGMDGKPSLLIGLSPRFHGFLQEYKKFVLEIAKICDYLNERYKATLLFIPIQRTFLYSQGYQWKYDDTVAEEATRLLRKKENVFILKREKYLPEEIAGVIGLLDLYISAPLHSLMAAFIQEVPMIGLDYSAQFDTKIPEFFESIDQCDFLISSYSKVTFSLLKNKLFKSFNSLPERKRVMKREKRLILSRAKSNFYWLFSILDRSSPRGSFVNYF